MRSKKKNDFLPSLKNIAPYTRFTLKWDLKLRPICACSHRRAFGMGLSSLCGVWEKEKFAEPSIIESYEPDRTKVIVEFDADESELGVKKQEVREKRLGSDGENLGSEDANSDFEVLMGAYRNDFRENARKILSAIAGDLEIDTTVNRLQAGCTY